MSGRPSHEDGGFGDRQALPLERITRITRCHAWASIILLAGEDLQDLHQRLHAGVTLLE
jgi:hypothetical protein